jgi:hypothetical protein
MSLWTPSGEHPVGPEPDGPRSGPATSSDEGAPSLEDLTPEQRAQAEEMARQMDEARARMLEMPSGVVIGQQALQFYELAALYLSQDTPRLADAQTAIDAFAAVVEQLGSRLGEAEDPLRQALNQIRLAYVEVTKQAGED